MIQQIHQNAHPTIYHKQITQSYHKYQIDAKKLKVNPQFTKNYLQEVIRNSHLFTKIPQQIEIEQKEDPAKGTTKQRFNNFATSPYFEKAIIELFRLPGHISELIIQLLTGWSWLNNTGKRYQILDTRLQKKRNC